MFRRRSELSDRVHASYDFCRVVHQTFGRTYYLATRLLPAWKRRHVHALYGFTRYTDEIVDHVDGTPTDRVVRLRAWRARFVAAAADTLASRAAAAHPVFPAVLNTMAVFQLDRADFDAFLSSMEMDLTITEYATYDALLSYMEGSAAAIGTMMLPILGAVDLAAAREPARQLGFAFQLTNFIRDVDEDLDRGRIYLPMKDLAEFGVTPEDLRERRTTPAIRELIKFEVARARHHYARAAPGVPMLSASSQPCIRTAFHAYGAILDEVIRQGYDVFRRRATVPAVRKVRLAAGGLLTPPGRAVRVLPGRPC
jgi:15-cis-phytoene synthase